MEFVKGKVVSALIKEKKHLDERAAIQIVIQVASALALIHKHGLVHRDVKPENIIIGEDGAAKLMDLGLVKSTVEDMTNLTQSGYAVGTPHYMSPEQMQGQAVDGRTDLYSLGATLYHMVTGEKPFRATTPMEILNKQLTKEIEDPKKIRPDLSNGLCVVIEKMLGRDPKERHANAQAVMDDLYLVLDGKPPKSERLAPGKSMIQRIGAPKATKRIAPATSRKPLSLPPKKSQMPLFAGIAAAIVAIVIVVAIVASPSKPAGPIRKPIEANPSVAVEEKFQKHLDAGELNQAVALLKLESETLGDRRVGELQAVVQVAAGRLWDQLPRTRSDLQAFRSQAGDVTGFREKIESELQKISASEGQDALRREADRQFKGLQDSVALLEANGEYDRAIATLEGARATSGDNPLLVAMIDRRIRALQETKPKPVEPKVPVGPDPAIETVFAKAKSDFDAGQFDASLATITEFLRKAPQEARGHALKAHCFLKKGNRANATIDADEAMRLDSTNAEAQLVAGILCVWKKEFEKASELLTRSISRDPLNPEAYVARAEAGLALGAASDTIQDLDEAVRLKRDLRTRRDAILLRVRALAELDRSDEALKECSDWISREPKELLPLIERAQINATIGKYKESKADLDKAYSIDPNNKEVIALRDIVTKATSTSAPPPKPKTSGKAAPTDFRKKLEAQFHASREQFQLLQDGRVLATLTYDFSKAEQLEDFERANVEPGGGFLKFTPGDPKPAMMTLKQRVKGDFNVVIDFVHQDASPKKNLGVGIQTQLSSDIEADQTDGVSFFFMNAPDWNINLQLSRKDGGDAIISDVKYIQDYKPGTPGRMTLRREGAKYTAIYGSFVTSGTQAGFDSTFLRIVSMHNVKVTRVDIQAVIEVEGVASEAPKAKTVALWNGRDLNNWQAFAKNYKIENGAIVFDTKLAEVLALKDPVNSGTYELTLTIDAMYDDGIVGIVIYRAGSSPDADGNLCCSISRSLFIQNRAEGTTKYLKFKQASMPLMAGRQYRLEMTVENGSITFKCGTDEISVDNAMPNGPFRPGIWIQDVKARITSFVKKETGPAPAAPAPKPQQVLGNALFNGRELSNWQMLGLPYKVENGTIKVEESGTGYLIYRNAFKSGTFEMQMSVDQCFQKAMAGFGLQFGGDTIEAEGNVVFNWGDKLYVYRFEGGSWKVIAKTVVANRIANGDYKMELVVQGRDVAFKVAGVGEVKASGVVPSGGSFRPAIATEDVKARIASFTQKGATAAPAPKEDPKKPASGSLFNGKDLNDWDDLSGGFQVEGGALVGDKNGGAALVHKNKASAKSARFELTFVVDEVYSEHAGIGIALQHRGDSLYTPGNHNAMFGKKYLLVNNLAGPQTWTPMQQVEAGKAVQKGPYKLELILDNGSLTLKLDGGVEVKQPGLVPPDTEFRPAIWVQFAKIRITGFSKK
jgi:tetratricopeptide (TPR) repeat protein